jgi:hypothetical protein
MFPNNFDFLIRQERYQDLLREAEQDRLIQVAKLRRSSKWDLPGQMANWLGSYGIKLGLKLQANCSIAPTCGGGCDLVKLKANTPI